MLKYKIKIKFKKYCFSYTVVIERSDVTYQQMLEMRQFQTNPPFLTTSCSYSLLPLSTSTSNTVRHNKFQLYTFTLSLFRRLSHLRVRLLYPSRVPSCSTTHVFSSSRTLWKKGWPTHIFLLCPYISVRFWTLKLYLYEWRITAALLNSKFPIIQIFR